MKRNFNYRFLHFWYSLLLSPPDALLVLYCAAVFLLFLPGIISPAAAALALLAAQGALCLWRLVEIKWLVRPISPYFAVYRFPGFSWRTLGQYQKGRAPDCRAALRGLAADRRTLPDAIPPGRYRCLTHETVLRRIQDAPQLQLLAYRPIGYGTLEGVWARMHGGRCARCPQRQNCRGAHWIRTPRQFFYVHFEKRG